MTLLHSDVIIIGLVFLIAIILLSWIIIQSIKFHSFSCAMGFHNWDSKLYESEDEICIVCRNSRCRTADYGM